MENLFKKLLKFVQNNGMFCISVAVLLLLFFNVFSVSNLFAVETFSNEDLKTGKKVNLKTSSGKYVSICEGAKCGKYCINSVCLEDENKGDASAFTLFVHNEKDKTVSLKSLKADYLFECESCSSTCKHIICADSTNVNAQPGIFKIVENKGKHLLQIHDGKTIQLCTECDPKCKLLCAKELKDLTADNLALEIIAV